MGMDWWKKSVVYQIYPRSFMDSNADGIGDIKGITSKLDYVKKLGIDVIWLSPIFDSPNDDNGYDIRDYQTIMSEFGTMEDFDNLLNAIHEKGMKVMLDLVVNHTSDEHAWFESAKASKSSPYREYYIFREGKNGAAPNNWTSVFGGSAWEYNPLTDDYYLHLFSKKQPDLNWESKNMRESIYEMMRFWLDKGIDGFRMDVINFISKDMRLPDGENGDGSPYFMNGPKVHDYLQEMNEKVLSHYDLITVGEMPGASPEDAILYTANDRKELQMIFTFEHMDLDKYEAKWDVKPLNLIDLKDNLSKWQLELSNRGWNSLYWNNHDQPRIVSRFGNDKKFRVESAKMLALCLHMLQGTPYIYQGEEFGMTNVAYRSIEEYKDIETINMYNERMAKGYDRKDIMNAIYKKGRDNARTPMQWTNEINGGFSKGEPWLAVNENYRTINANAAVSDEQSIFYFYKQLINARKKYDVIINGSYQLLHREHPELFIYTRETEKEKLLIICNFSEKTVALQDKNLENELQNYEVLLTNIEENKNKKLLFQPYEAVAYYKVV